jgi:acyl-CoA thioester hydrolase
MAFRFRHPVEVRFRDCDAMGHVNHAVYFTYLEIARFGYWKAAGVGRLEGDASYIIAHAECDYRAAARTGDVLEVRTGVTLFGRTSFTMEYEVVDQAGRTVVNARTVQVMYDYGKQKPVAIPAGLRARIEAFEAAR